MLSPSSRKFATIENDSIFACLVRSAFVQQRRTKNAAGYFEKIGEDYLKCFFFVQLNNEHLLISASLCCMSIKQKD